jgi:hypothetical protein
MSKKNLLIALLFVQLFSHADENEKEKKPTFFELFQDISILYALTKAKEIYAVLPEPIQRHFVKISCMAVASMAAFYSLKKIYINPFASTLDSMKRDQAANHQQQSNLMNQLQNKANELAERIKANGKLFKLYFLAWMKAKEENKEQMDALAAELSSLKTEALKNHDKQMGGLAHINAKIDDRVGEIRTDLQDLRNLATQSNAMLQRMNAALFKDPRISN